MANTPHLKIRVMKTPLSHPTFLRPVSLALLLAAADVSARTASVQVVAVPVSGSTPAVVVTDTAVPPTPAADAPGNGAATKPATEGKADKPAPPTLGEALKTMKFDRSGEALLVATKAQRKDTSQTPEEAFNMAVMFGDWGAVGKMLAAIPTEEAVAGYTRLLDSLAAQSVSVGVVLKTAEKEPEDEEYNERNQRLQREREELKKHAAPLLSEDFYALVGASPGDIREENIPALTKLVRTALGEGGRATLVARMQTEWKGLGGATPEGRKLATKLLSSLGWIKDAAQFLPLNSEEWDDADTTQLVYAMEYFTQTGIADHDERQLQKAADIAARLMKTARFGNYTRPQFRLAMDRLVRLLPVLEPEQAKKLIREQLFAQTATLSDLLAIIGEVGQTATKGTDIAARAASLGTQHLLLETLAGKEGELPPNTAVLVMNWLTEAEGCYRAGGVVATEMSQSDRMMMRRYGYWNNQEKDTPTLGTEQILASAPPLELLPRINPGLAQRVRLTLVKVNILRPDEVDLRMLKDYVKQYPGLEREVAQDVLSGWVSKRTKPSESPQVKQMRAYGMYIPPQILQQGAGIPLTRLRQNQNIQHFKTLLAELRTISPEPLDASLIVQAFMTLHSGAEVYRLEDIEAIFGPPEKMIRKELLDLLGGMRGRLGQEWRDIKTQQQAATNRTKEEAKDEVSRGYRTAMELARRGIRAEDNDWASFVTRGQLFYDASQYELERQVKLTEYVSLRDEAFASFRKATEIYAAQIPNLPRGQWTIEPYQDWFFVMLGSSDLARLTTNTARTDPGLKSIGDAMRALPAGAGDKHLEMFAKMLGELFPRVPANVRQLFLGSGLSIVGADNPAAASVTKSLDYYRELLSEIQLRVQLDGPANVGHGKPFGAFLSLETTRQLLRESGGFSKYLQGPGGRQAMMGGGDGKNLREDFTKNIHAALDETFEVVSITFHDPAVKTIDPPREGWVETPLAYLVLRAKNAAVDRIPSIQLDMDFMDQPGQVVLPVMSQVESVDAREADVAPRPCSELAINLTMDEREWRDGKVVVEIQARGRGVIPNLDKLFEVERPGFDLETSDGNLSVSEFVSDGKRRLPKADRNWQLTYRRKADLRGDVLFPFPKLRPDIKADTVEYKHYHDADLVTVDAATANSGVKLSGEFGSGIGALLLWLLPVGALAAAWHFLRKKKSPGAGLDRGIAAPDTITAFTTVALLRRIRAARADVLTEEEKTALTDEIGAIEAAAFGRVPGAPKDLDAIVRKWLEVARRTDGNPA